MPEVGPCPYLEIIVRPAATAETRYRCSWCEEGMMRKCNVLKTRDRYWCPLDEFGNKIEWQMGKEEK